MNNELVIAQCRAMTLLLNDRLGDVNPWASVDFAKLEPLDLALAKKLMHELLYTPPVRS